jgi:hypothetical protein
MSPIIKAFSVVAIAAAIGGCVMQHGPEGVAYSTPSGGVGATSGIGVTGGDAGGSLSGGSGSQNGVKEKRANTPIGMDRDGHGPAAGAILDPTGAATRGRPY